jgi:hypothetical protein
MGPQSDAHLEIMWAIMFQNVIGSFMYATIYIRLDIVHVVWVANQFMVNHGQSHWIVMKWIFHYLKGIMDFGLCFKKNIRMLLWAKYHLMRMLTIARAMHVLKGMKTITKVLETNEGPETF